MVSQQLRVLAQASGDTCTVKVAGDLDLASVREFHEAVSQVCRDGARAVVLDLRDLHFMDSSGLHEILSLRHQVAISVRHASRAVRRLFEVAGIPLEH